MLSKKNIFRIILVLIPFILFLVLELILRAFGYADDLRIVATIDRNGKEYYTINQLVGKRYFNKDRLYYRNAAGGAQHAARSAGARRAHTDAQAA